MSGIRTLRHNRIDLALHELRGTDPAHPAARPLLLLHGGSGSWNHWVRNLAALARCGRRVLVPDMPGFGDSDAPPDGSDADALPRWLELGVRHLLGARTIDVAGFSFGAWIATKYCFSPRAPKAPGRIWPACSSTSAVDESSATFSLSSVRASSMGLSTQAPEEADGASAR